MASSEEFIERADSSSVFTDTCILLDYVLRRDDHSIEIFDVHSARKVVSKSVEHEFGKVRNRLKVIVKQMKTYARRGELADYELPDDDEFNKNDERFVADLKSELDRTTEDEIEAGRRLKEYLRWLEAGKRDLFDESTGHIDEVWSGTRDPGLQGYLQVDVENPADVRVLCDAVDWAVSSSDGTGTLVTADWGDLLSNREKIAATTERHDSSGELTVLRPSEFLQV